jgi:hypothetical protein
VKLADVGDGIRFRTRLTRRSGLVLAHTPRGVLVRWRDGNLYYIHQEVEVDEMEAAS